VEEAKQAFAKGREPENGSKKRNPEGMRLMDGVESVKS